MNKRTKIIIALAAPFVAYGLLVGMVFIAQHVWFGPGPELEKFALSLIKGFGLGVLGLWSWLLFGKGHNHKTGKQPKKEK
ncbi:hypothetical protein LR013_06160 [candidate division NPL-UPA2 bacterium]|nr:hypothetical protein [candidate division NPL-UPA2 bacterium]